MGFLLEDKINKKLIISKLIKVILMWLKIKLIRENFNQLE